MVPRTVIWRPQRSFCTSCPIFTSPKAISRKLFIFRRQLAKKCTLEFIFKRLRVKTKNLQSTVLQCGTKALVADDKFASVAIKNLHCSLTPSLPAQWVYVSFYSRERKIECISSSKRTDHFTERRDIPRFTGWSIFGVCLFPAIVVVNLNAHFPSDRRPLLLRAFGCRRTRLYRSNVV